LPVAKEDAENVAIAFRQLLEAPAEVADLQKRDVPDEGKTKGP
jgi:hypothetical protein